MHAQGRAALSGALLDAQVGKEHQGPQAGERRPTGSRLESGRVRMAPCAGLQ
jgi:hypothetical protein